MSDDLKPRILAIDVGEKRIGFAVSDPMGHFAVGLETLEVRSKGHVLETVANFCKHYDVATLVIGLPVSMNGQEGPAAERVRALAQEIGKTLPGIPIEFFDERLTSVLALQTLQAQGIKASRNKGLIDQAAAKRILQDYLDRQSFRSY